MTALSSGGLGDIVYSIPILKELGVDTLRVKLAHYFPPYGTLHSAIKKLVENEGIKCEPYPYCGMYQYPEPVHYDMDRFRKQPNRGIVFIQTNMRRHFKLPEKEYAPWLSLKTEDKGYAVIHLTDRWRENSRVNWTAILHSLQGQPVKFIGFQHEWLDFCTRHGNVEWYPTNDIFDMAELIAGCSALYCNQSVSLTLAQGMGKKYYLELKPGKTNTRIYQPIENIL